MHHVNGEGEDAGVVYCEMQARENTAQDRTHFHLVHHMYPGHCGYKVGHDPSAQAGNKVGITTDAGVCCCSLKLEGVWRISATAAQTRRCAHMGVWM